MNTSKLNILPLIGINDLQEEHFERLQQLCEIPISILPTLDELIKLPESLRNDVIVILVKRDIKINDSHLDFFPNLKYVGVYGTTLKDIQLPENITKRGVFLYCDRDTAEFVLIETFKLIRGLGEHQWKNLPQSIAGLKIGIIGLGAVGLELAKLMMTHGLEVYYTGPHPSKDESAKSYHYFPLDRIEEFFITCNIISIHTPAISGELINQNCFHHLRNDCILVNTSLGNPFNTNNLHEWLKKSKGYYITDKVCANEMKVHFTHPRFIAVNQYAYKTQDSMFRLGEGLVGQLEKWIDINQNVIMHQH